MNEQKPGPIRFDNIRQGDTVERKLKGVTATITVAMRVSHGLVNSQGGDLNQEAGATWKLLERRVVDLPTVPTWGWVTHFDGTHHFGQWALDSDPNIDLQCLTRKRQEAIYMPPDEAADFVPVELIPTALVNDLRDLVTKAASTERAADGPLSMFVNIAGRFLDFVDRTTVEETS